MDPQTKREILLIAFGTAMLEVPVVAIVALAFFGPLNRRNGAGRAVAQSRPIPTRPRRALPCTSRYMTKTVQTPRLNRWKNPRLVN